MKQLEKEFIKNVDSCGDNRFFQLLRKNDVAVYSRTKLDGRICSYEVFKIKVIKAGTSLPGGGVVEEDYERYPSKNDFGKTAMHIGTFNNQIDPESLYETFSKKYNLLDENKNSTSLNEFILPEGIFTVKNMLELNPLKNYTDCYQYIKLNEGVTVEFVEQRLSESGRGKPSNFYQKK